MNQRAPRRTWARLATLAARASGRLVDPARLSHYRRANAAIGSQADPRARVVFLGDSIFEGWRDLESLAPDGLRYLNRGIAGQTSGEMLARFQEDVLALAPQAVTILAGSNDLRAFLGDPAAKAAPAAARVAQNVTAMADVAGRAGVSVILCALPPIRPRPRRAWRVSARRDPAGIRTVNAWLSAFAAGRGFLFIDFHAALADGGGALDSALSDDGLHPNTAGYERMAAVLVQAVPDGGRFRM